MTDKVKHRVCVFCGARTGPSADYREITAECGRKLAANGFDLVYGGGNAGLMGVVSKAAHDAGAHVIGIFPVFLEEYEKLNHDLDNTILVDNMSRRKDMLLEHADSFLILPGGFGTLDEIFEVITLAALHQHDKRIIIFNYKGYWDPLIALLEHVYSNEFASVKVKKSYTVVKTLDEALAILKS
ncbi:MAG: TIGR00730 family Rossman fold protein [Proteobacteria bacterium]|nr:TIGR00730 family Rossman fold protein [Pseudomonadota bacterium]